MKLTRIVLASVCTAAILSLSPAHAQIADWTFQSDAIGTNNSPVADIGTGTATSIGMTNTLTSPNSTTKDDVVLGTTSDTGSNTVADLTNEWRVRSTGSGEGNGWDSAAAIGTQGAVFSASTAGITSGAIKVSFDWYSTTQGEANMEFLYSTNGGSTWTNLALTLAGSDAGLVNKTGTVSDTNTTQGAYVSDNLAVNGLPAGQDWFTGLTATITDPNALNDSGFEVEMVNASTGTDCVSTQGTALNNTSGNWRFDNVDIVAVPEPSAWVLGLGAAGLFLVVRRARLQTARQ